MRPGESAAEGSPIGESIQKIKERQARRLKPVLQEVKTHIQEQRAVQASGKGAPSATIGAHAPVMPPDRKASGKALPAYPSARTAQNILD